MSGENGDSPPKVTMSVGMKVNLGNYESADVSIILSHVPVGATAEEVDEMLDTGRIVFERMRERLKEKVRNLREVGSM